MATKRKDIKSQDQSVVDETLDQKPLSQSERAELEQLRAEKENFDAQAQLDSKYLQEMQTLKQKGTAGLQTIPVKEIFDVKFISLWHVSGHNYGKRVGPIHPAAAEDTFLMFRKAGIRLSATQPTAQETEAYKQTAEFKRAMEKENVRRQTKKGKKGTMEKLIEAIAQKSGIPASQVVQIAGKPAGVEV